MSIHPRLKAFQSLVQLRGGAEQHVRAIGTFAGDIANLVEARNRAVHDPRMVRVDGSTVEKLTITAQRKLAFGFKPEDVARLDKTHSDIRAALKRFRLLKKRAITAIRALPEEQRPKLIRINQVEPDHEGQAS